MATSNDTTPMKTCTKCGGEYPATREFFKTDNRVKSGISSLCKNCQHQYNHERWQEPEVQEHHRNYQNAQRLIPEKHALLLAREKRQREGIVYQEYRHSPEFRAIRRLNQAQRRARQMASGNEFTATDVELQIKAQTDKHNVLRCWWCGKPIEDEYHIDHAIPLFRGGSNGPENIRIAHPLCNLKKHAKLPQEMGRLL